MLLTGIWINNVGFDCNNEIPYLSNTFGNLLFPATEPIFIRMSFDKSKQLITYNHINGVGLFLIWILWRHFWCTDIKHEFKNRDKCTKKDNNNNSNSEAVCYYIMFSFLHWNSQHPLYDIVLISQKQMQVKSTIIQKQAIFRRRVVMYIVQTICSYILKCGCSDTYNILSYIQYMRSTVLINNFL